MKAKILVVGRSDNYADYVANEIVQSGSLTKCHVRCDKNGHAANIGECEAADVLAADPRAARSLLMEMDQTAFLLACMDPWREDDGFEDEMDSFCRLARKGLLSCRDTNCIEAFAYDGYGGRAGYGSWEAAIVRHVLEARRAVLKLSAMMKACNIDGGHAAEAKVLRAVRECPDLVRLFGRPENSDAIAAVVSSVEPAEEIGSGDARHGDSGLNNSGDANTGFLNTGNAGHCNVGGRDRIH